MKVALKIRGLIPEQDQEGGPLASNGTCPRGGTWLLLDVEQPHRGFKLLMALALSLAQERQKHNTEDRNSQRLVHNDCTQLPHSTKATRPEESPVPPEQHFTPTPTCASTRRQERNCVLNAANVVFIRLLTRSQCSQLSQLDPLIILFHSSVT